jgi:hypothetical protein
MVKYNRYLAPSQSPADKKASVILMKLKLASLLCYVAVLLCTALFVSLKTAAVLYLVVTLCYLPWLVRHEAAATGKVRTKHGYEIKRYIALALGLWIIHAALHIRTSFIESKSKMASPRCQCCSAI